MLGLAGLDWVEGLGVVEEVSPRLRSHFAEWGGREEGGLVPLCGCGERRMFVLGWGLFCTIATDKHEVKVTGTWDGKSHVC